MVILSDGHFYFQESMEKDEAVNLFGNSHQASRVKFDTKSVTVSCRGLPLGTFSMSCFRAGLQHAQRG